MNSQSSQLQDFNTKLPLDVLHRLRLEARRTGKTIRTILAAALDQYLPQDVKFEAIARKRVNA